MPLYASPVVPSMAREGIPVVEMLKADGTLDLEKGVSGTLDLAGWDVTLDPARGPVFTAAPRAGEKWSSVGSQCTANNTPVNFVAKFAPTPTGGCTGKPTKPTLKSPENNAIVDTLRPKLKWKIANCAETYKVTVKDAATGNGVDSSPEMTGLKYKTRQLTAGTSYKWFVKACNGEGCAKSKGRLFSTP